jgi:ubiquinone/menaquinone biosynthesis C-methylase UbiE
MAEIGENELAALLLGNCMPRAVEANIYSVLPDNKSGNEYDSQFGFIYDLVACNPIYNRLIWGYSVRIFSQTASEALHSSHDGHVLDIGCGSLAFTAKTYSQYRDRLVVLVDQSLKMLRMAKSRLLKKIGKIPENLVFLHADALQLPFQENIFSTILSENLLHCLSDTNILLKQLKSITAKDGRMYFTTLVKSNRWADKYLQALADGGKLISRTVADHKEIFQQVGLSAKYDTTGNILVIIGNK